MGAFTKGARLLGRPRFAVAALRYKVAAAVEHLPVIRQTMPGSLIDVGANKGQFSLAFRAARPHAPIVAFEPLPDAARRFERMFGRDGRVLLHRLAIASEEGTASFHVADRSDSSSLLPPGPGQDAAFGVKGAETIEVVVKRLGSCVDFASLPRPIMMKIDVQGAELEVLRGCDELEQIDYIYVELSFVELYEEQPLFGEVSAYLASRGFSLAGVFNQVTSAAFGPTQADLLFKRAE